MWFKDLAKWDRKKIVLYIAIFGTLYAIFSTFVPCVIVGCQYKLFAKAGSFKLTAVGMIVVLMISTFGIKAITWIIGRLPQEDRKEQIIRYSVEMICKMAIPCLCIWILHLIRTNVDLACDTIQYCIYSYLVGIFVECTCLKSLFNELDCFSEAKHNKRVKAKEDIV